VRPHHVRELRRRARGDTRRPDIFRRRQRCPAAFADGLRVVRRVPESEVRPSLALRVRVGNRQGLTYVPAAPSTRCLLPPPSFLPCSCSVDVAEAVISCEYPGGHPGERSLEVRYLCGKAYTLPTAEQVSRLCSGCKEGHGGLK
jgi:hypothetical protein